jgi:hypothetical protein
MVVGKDGDVEKDEAHAGEHGEDGPDVPQGEVADPEKEESTRERDRDSDEIEEGEAVQGVRQDMDEKDSGKEAGEVVIPLHGGVSLNEIQTLARHYAAV